MNLNEPKKERSVLWETAPGIVISVVLVVFLVWIVDWESLVRAFAAVPPSLAAALFALQTIAFIGSRSQDSKPIPTTNPKQIFTKSCLDNILYFTS